MNSSIKIDSKFPKMGITIFTLMTAMANEFQAINLAQGFPDFDCSMELINGVKHYMKKGFNQYAPMSGVLPLRRVLSAKNNHLYSAEYDDNDEITIVPGATLGLFCAISTVVKEGDEVIVIEPAYDSYVPAILLNGGKPVFSKLKHPFYTVDWLEIRKLINFKTKAIIINTPHNPSGTVWSAQDLAQLEKLTENTDIVIISDEVYEHILFDGLEHQSIARFPKLASRSFIVGSFGKTFHNTGWKIGFVLAPSHFMMEFRKIYQYVAFTTNTPIQYALADHLEEPDRYLKLAKFYQLKRDFFRSKLKNSAFKLFPCQGSYFQLLGFDKLSQKYSDIAYAEWLTKEKKVASIPVSVFYHDKLDHRVLRFCFAKNEETLEKAAEILCNI